MPRRWLLPIVQNPLIVARVCIHNHWYIYLKVLSIQNLHAPCAMMRSRDWQSGIGAGGRLAIGNAVGSGWERGQGSMLCKSVKASKSYLIVK